LLVVLLAVGLVADVVERMGLPASVAVGAVAGGLALYLHGRYKAAQAAAHRRRLETATLAQFLALSPTEFEHAVADVLRAHGFASVRVTGGSGDLAADITCRGPDGRFTVVQCKRYAPGASVGSQEIQSFIGMIHVHHRADAGIFVTSSNFTLPATKLAREHGLTLVDGG
jgi:restriction system protein